MKILASFMIAVALVAGSVWASADSRPTGGGPTHLPATSASAVGWAGLPTQSRDASASAPTSFTKKFRRSDRAFLITTEAEVVLPENGMLMACPAHAHGSPGQALAKLKDMLSAVPSDQLTSIWVCRADEAQTLKRFAPLVDQVVLNPFTAIEAASPDKTSAIWPGCDQPVLNFVRLLRLQSDTKRLIACINTAGEPSFFKKRSPSLEEIEWMIGAVVGANYQGIAWRCRGEISEEFDGLLQRRLGELSRFAPDLGTAEICTWADGDGKAPISALRSQQRLFVVVLNPYYMQPRADGSIPLPVEHQRAQGAVRLRLPEGVTAREAKCISGQPAAIKDGTLSFSSTQGCEIFVIELSGTPTSASSTASATRGAK